MQNWDEKENNQNQTNFVTINKKHLERIFMLIGAAGVLTGFAIYANFFNVC